MKRRLASGGERALGCACRGGGFGCWRLPVRRSAADLATLSAVRWGMDADELDRALGSADSRLPGRWDFGRYYADSSVEDVEVAGLPFRAFLQMDRKSGKLAQVLLERRGQQATPMVFEDIANALIGQFGEPAENRQRRQCRRAGLGPAGLEAARYDDQRQLLRLPDLGDLFGGPECRAEPAGALFGAAAQQSPDAAAPGADPVQSSRM